MEYAGKIALAMVALSFIGMLLLTLVFGLVMIFSIALDVMIMMFGGEQLPWTKALYDLR